MGNAIITNAGKSYLAAKQAASEPAALTEFVFALVPGLVTSSTPAGTESLPPVGQIQHTCPVTRAGYVTPDQVVYSVLLDSTIGDWNYNWLGIKTDNGTLAAVVYVDETNKQKYDPLLGHIGNNLTRNILLQYDNLQTITGITVDAATWQIDFTQRLNASDDMQEALAKALLGDGAVFLGNALAIENDAGFKMRAGRSVVHGMVVDLQDDVNAAAAGAAAGKDIWADIWRSGDNSGVTVNVSVVADIPSAVHSSYTDSNGIAHTVVKVASISAGSVVTDLRGTGGNTVIADDDVLSGVLGHMTRTDNPHAVTKEQVGLGNLPNAKGDVADNDNNTLATLKAVWDAFQSAITTAAANLAAHAGLTNNPHAVTKVQVGLGNLPNAKSDSATLNDTNSLATSKAVYSLQPQLIKGALCWNGSTLAINSSFNIESIVEFAQGRYEITFINDLPAGYSAVFGNTAGPGGTNGSVYAPGGWNTPPDLKTTKKIRVSFGNGNDYRRCHECSVIFI